MVVRFYHEDFIFSRFLQLHFCALICYTFAQKGEISVNLSSEFAVMKETVICRDGYLAVLQDSKRDRH